MEKKEPLQPRCPSTEEWIQIQCAHTMEFYSVIKNEIMSFVSKRIELKFISVK
jgi:hypothetical protein